MLDQCCEVLTASIINKEALYLRADTTQLRWWSEAVKEKRVDRQEGGLGELKETVGNKANQKL